MTKGEAIKISRRHLITMSGLSAGATLLAGRPLFADQDGIMSTRVDTKGEYAMAQATTSAVRPFRVNVPKAELNRIAPAHKRNTVA